MNRDTLKPEVVAVLKNFERDWADSESGVRAIRMRRMERIERARRERALRWKTQAPSQGRRGFKKRVKRSR